MPLTLHKNNFLVNLICRLQFVPINRVQGYTSVDGFEKQVQATFFNIYASPASIIFTQEEEKTASGSLYSQRITLSYPGLMRHNAEALYNLDQLEHLVKFVDDKGQVFIMGSLDAGALLNWEYSSTTGAHTLNFTLTDTFPIGYDKELGRFFIDERGYLMTTYESSETFYLDAGGNLVVDGPDEAEYFIQNGQLFRVE